MIRRMGVLQRCYGVLATGFLLLSPLVGAVQTSSPVETGEPEAATGRTEKKAHVAKQYMVVAANPYASWAGKNVLEKGGSAMDAAVAVQAMLTLVEPQSSGIGGGAFILYWDNQNKQLYTFDGREMAPAGVNPYWFMDKNKPMTYLEALVGGKSVGVPGALRALETGHAQFGKLAWNSLFDDAAATAAKGFKVSARARPAGSAGLPPGSARVYRQQHLFLSGRTTAQRRGQQTE